MKLYFIFFFFFIAVAYGGNIRGDLLPKCRKSDPQIEKCILDGVEKLRPMLKEPFKISQLDVSSSHGVANDVKGTVKNVEARRFTDYKIRSLKVNLQNKNQYTADLELELPHLVLSADYTLQGVVFGLDFKSHGKFKGSLRNIVVVGKNVASLTTRDGVEYLKVDDVTTKITIGGRANLKLKPADRSFMGKEIASYAHSDPNGALQMVAPAINENVARMVKEFLNKVLAQVPLKNLLLD